MAYFHVIDRSMTVFFKKRRILLPSLPLKRIILIYNIEIKNLKEKREDINFDYPSHK